VARAPSNPTDVTINIAVLGRGVFAEGQVLSPARAWCPGERSWSSRSPRLATRSWTSTMRAITGSTAALARCRGQGPRGLKVKAPRTVVGRPGHRQACRRDAFAVHIPPG